MVRLPGGISGLSDGSASPRRLQGYRLEDPVCQGGPIRRNKNTHIIKP